ncbi:hypothetical protein ACFSX9_06920 [Flavobacterium ardleyense]|uniref:DUF2874 domain containing protein n=1 Tax=Flavobacterium ardleyense TaxID=2038737 RepID=A0ABW5Z6I1_9FLAO
MKKVILMAVFAFATLSATATTTEMNATTISTSIENEFKEIAVTEVAKPVLQAVLKDYEGATIKQAFVNEKNEYKLELTIGEVVKTVYADAEGNWIEK